LRYNALQINDGDKRMQNKLIMVIAVAFLALAACEKQGPMEKAGEKIDDAVENVKDKTEDVVDDAADKVEEAGDKIEKAADKVDDGQ